MDKQQSIEFKNALEEIREIVSPCVKCGMCKANCGVFKVLREESVSPRGKAIILSDKIMDKIVFECNLCKACEEKCPLNLKITDAVRRAREAMVLSGKELKENKEMAENARKTGNPFGENFENKDKLYCC